MYQQLSKTIVALRKDTERMYFEYYTAKMRQLDLKRAACGKQSRVARPGGASLPAEAAAAVRVVLSLTA